MKKYRLASEFHKRNKQLDKDGVKDFGTNKKEAIKFAKELFKQQDKNVCCIMVISYEGVYEEGLWDETILDLNNGEY